MVESNSQDCQSNYVQILHPFYVEKLSYEPSVSIKLLKCMGLLFEVTYDSLRNMRIDGSFVVGTIGYIHQVGQRRNSSKNTRIFK